MKLHSAMKMGREGWNPELQERMQLRAGRGDTSSPEYETWRWGNAHISTHSKCGGRLTTDITTAVSVSMRQGSPLRTLGVKC